MSLKLLIVESPAKCKKIQGFLGAGWRVQATMGHIRALKEDLNAIGFDAARGATQQWRPDYEAIGSKREAIANLKRAAAGAQVYLGADDDREGEAIAWHTCAILGLDPATTPRVVFHEITEPALKAAVAAPGRIDMNKFSAQQARTMLDMLIGFTLSPCLWRGVGYKAGLSAGRCQTPALRIIYDRDIEIEKHQSATSWRVAATSDHGLQWRATTEYESDTRAFDVLKQLPVDPRTLTVKDRTERVSTHQPPKPFITSSLQQEASSRLSMNPKVTMRAAQTLYEAGHITYMRTDNAILSQEAIDAASAVVKARWGDEYLGGVAAPSDAIKKKVVKKKAAAAAAHEVAGGKPATTASIPASQNAHEGIRPTHMEVDCGDQLEGMGAQEQRLYTLIWKRTIQSVMAAEQRDVVKMSAVPTPKPTLLALETTWDQTRFAGWRILDAERKEEEEAAAAATFDARKGLAVDQQISWTTFTAAEQRTAQPPRYTEAALIRELEGRGIGRPSTYATLVETVMERTYVEKATIPAQTVELRGLELKSTAKLPKQTTRKEKTGGEKDKLRATPLGRTVIEWLLAQFGDMLEYDFTAAMEQQLDEVAKGNRQWPSVLQETWAQYADRYASVMAAPKASGSTGTNSSANKAEFGDGYKMVVSKKGPLFVLERDGEKTRFASVPAHLSIQTATRADAEAAFAAATAATTGEVLGTLEGTPVIKRKGPYGFYVSWREQKLNCKPEETFDEISARLQAKAAAKTNPDAVDHQVGPYKIKRGPYGLYMFKQAAAGKKPVFVGIPAETPWATLTPESAEQVYNLAAAAKKDAPRKQAPAKQVRNKDSSS